MACGNALAEGGAFCANCGRPVHQTAQVSTSHADVQVPPPPYEQQAPSYYPQNTRSSVAVTPPVRARNYWITFAVLAVLALIAGDTGTTVSVIGLITSTVWVFRDAKSRGMNPTNWAVGVLLLWIVFFPLYFFKRRPHRV